MSARREVPIQIDPTLDGDSHANIAGSIIIDASRTESDLPPGVVRAGEFTVTTFSGTPHPPLTAAGKGSAATASVNEDPRRPTPAKSSAFVEVQLDKESASTAAAPAAKQENPSIVAPTAGVPAVTPAPTAPCPGCAGRHIKVQIAVENLVSFTTNCHDVIGGDHFLVLVHRSDEAEAVSLPDTVAQGTRVAVYVEGSDTVNYVELIGVKFLHMGHVYTTLLVVNKEPVNTG